MNPKENNTLCKKCKLSLCKVVNDTDLGSVLHVYCDFSKECMYGSEEVEECDRFEPMNAKSGWRMWMTFGL